MNKKHLSELFFKTINLKESKNFSINGGFNSSSYIYFVTVPNLEYNYDKIMGTLSIECHSNIEKSYENIEEFNEETIFGIKYQIRFSPVNESSMVKIPHIAELTSKEFVILLRMFKKRYQIELSKAKLKTEEEDYSTINKLNEQYQLDCVPLKRKILIEKS